MVANVSMSLAPKITDVAEFAMRKDFNLACITETWLKECIADSVVEISNYSVIRLDRQVVEYVGVCLYKKTVIQTTGLLKSANVARNTKYYGTILGLLGKMPL